MVTPVAHLRWLDAWTNQMAAAQSLENLRAVHRWMWSTWRGQGAKVAAGLNTSLRLDGDDQMQPDVPHLFAGQVEATDLLFLNINPGWDLRRNAVENAIVARSEEESWSFSRALFTRYPAEVGRMNWWSQAIGIAWRVMHGTSPAAIPSREKRNWANVHIGGWELLPFHSRSAGFLQRLDDGPSGSSVKASMRVSLQLAVRFAAKITLVASRNGAAFANELATRKGWPEMDVGQVALPPGTRAYRINERLLLALPRQLVSKYSGVRFDEISSAIRQLHIRAEAEAR